MLFKGLCTKRDPIACSYRGYAPVERGRLEMTIKHSSADQDQGGEAMDGNTFFLEERKRRWGRQNSLRVGS